MRPTSVGREGLVLRLQRELTPRPEIVLALLDGSFQRGESYWDIDVLVWQERDLSSGEARGSAPRL